MTISEPSHLRSSSLLPLFYVDFFDKVGEETNQAIRRMACCTSNSKKEEAETTDRDKYSTE